MTCGSLFAGIGGFDLGFERAGFKSLWQVEIEPFPMSVLEKRFPNAFKFKDVRDCGKHNLGPVDVVTAGFPCQDLSVAGKRAGLEGARSGLFWEVVRILGELRPAWFVLENVPGLFSSCEGRDFAIVLNALDELGYGLAWRVLNSQFFGVAQRRRRVFIVGCLGKPCPQEVLFESESGGGDLEESGETRKELASEIAASLRGGSADDPRGFRLDDETGLTVAFSNRGIATDKFETVRSDCNGALPMVASYVPSTAPSLTTRDYKGTRCDIEEPAFVAYHENIGGNVAGAGQFIGSAPDSDRMRNPASLPQGMDSARYRALGNAVTANVAEWIGRRIIEATGEARCQ